MTPSNNLRAFVDLSNPCLLRRSACLDVRRCARRTEERTSGRPQLSRHGARGDGPHEVAVAEVTQERTDGLAVVAQDRAKALTEVDGRREELSREIEATHMHKVAQEGRVELNIGGYRFQTSVQTLQRVPVRTGRVQ